MHGASAAADTIIRACKIDEGTLAFEALALQRHRWLALTATVIASAVVLLDSTVVNIALPAIQRALRADAAATQWIVNAYLLLLGPLVLIGGSAADLYGRRRIFVLGTAIFAAASIVSGLAPNVTALIVSRAAQGFGGALLTPASLAILQTTFDERERSKAIGIWAGAGALMMAVGPLLGGWLVDQISWRAIFLINIPLAGTAAGLAICFAPESRDRRAKQLDLAGAASVAIGLAALTWSLTAVSKSGFRDEKVLAALATGIVLLTSFVAIEAYLGDRAMMPLSLFRSRNFSTMNGLTLLLYFALSGALYFLPFGLIRLGGYSATQAGAALSPFALIVGLGSLLVGSIASRLNWRLLLTLGPVIVACGFALLALIDFKQSYWTGIFPSMLLLGVGMAITVQPLTSTVLTSSGEVHAGIASGINNAVARVAGLLAVAALGALFFTNFSSHFTGAAPAQVSDALNAVMRGQASAKPEAIAAFRHALRVVMLVPAGCAALAGLIAWLWTDPRSLHAIKTQA